MYVDGENRVLLVSNAPEQPQKRFEFLVDRGIMYLRLKGLTFAQRWLGTRILFSLFSLHVEVEGRIERLAERWVGSCGKWKSWPLKFGHRYQFSYRLLAHISNFTWILLATNS